MPEASHASSRSRRSKRSRRRGRRRAGGAGNGGMPTCALRDEADGTEQLRGRAGAGGATTNRRYSRSDDSVASGGAKCGRRVLPPFARFSAASGGRARAPCCTGRRPAPTLPQLHSTRRRRRSSHPRRQSPFTTKWWSHYPGTRMYTSTAPTLRIHTCNLSTKQNERS